MSEDKRSSWFRWVMFPVITVMFYVLSVGPAIFIHRRFPTSRPVLEAIYAPLESIAEHNKLVTDYANWWSDLAK